jgi:hypothetical protein
MGEKEAVIDKDTDNQKEEQEQKQSEQEAIENVDKSPEQKENAQSAAMDRVNQIYTEKMMRIEEKRLNSQAEMNKLAAGNEEELELLTKQEMARAEFESALLKKDTEINKLGFDVDSIDKNRKNAITKKGTLMKEKSSQEKRKATLENDIKADKEAIEASEKELDKVKNHKEAEPDKAGDDKKTEKTEKADKAEKTEKIEKTEETINKEIKKKKEDLEKKSKELEEAKNKIEGISKQIEDLETQINTMQEEQEKAKQELERLKTEQATNKEALSQMQEEGKKSEPEWYAKYKEEKSRYESMTAQLDSVAHEKEEVGNLVKESDENSSEDPNVIVEEAKVENALKNAPVLKDINKNTIDTYLNYNPETGKQYEEGEEKKSSNVLINNIDKLFSDENKAKVKEAVEKLKSNDVITKIDSFISSSKFAENPISQILDAIENLDKDKIKSAITGFVEKYSSDEVRKESPIIYAVGNMVFSTLGDVLNSSGKDDFSVGASEEEGGGIVSDALAKISNMENWKSMIDTVGKTALTTVVKNSRVNKMATNITDAGKNVVDSVSSFKNAHDLKKEKEEMEKSGDANADKYVRIMSGARKASMSNGVANIVNAGANVGKGFATSFLGTTAGKAVNLGITLGSTIINKLISKGFEKSHVNEVLNSPYALGGVKYDEKLVKKDKFNQILKKVSGITSKDKLYGAIKTVDAISLHAAMRKSYQEPDHTADRALANLGISDRSAYPRVSVYDIMKRSGHEPSGGDWRQELKNSLVEDGKDYPSVMSAIGGHIKNGAKKVGKAVKSAVSWIKGKVSSLWNSKNKKSDDDEDVALAV